MIKVFSFIEKLVIGKLIRLNLSQITLKKSLKIINLNIKYNEAINKSFNAG